MSVIRVGSNGSYAEGWNDVFGAAKGKATAGKKTLKKAAKKAAAKPAASKKAAAVKKPAAVKKAAKPAITKTAKNIGSMLLLRIDKNQVYEGGLFEKRQQEHRASMCSQLESTYSQVMDTLRTIYKHFREGSSEVKREWRSQVTQIDKMMEVSLKLAVKRSLQELSRAINGDSKTDPQTLFTVQIVLESHGRVSYQPSMVNLTHSVNIVAKDIISIVTSFPRVRGQTFETGPGAGAAAAAIAPNRVGPVGGRSWCWPPRSRDSARGSCAGWPVPPLGWKRPAAAVHRPASQPARHTPRPPLY
jgi:hypothetical protein